MHQPGEDRKNGVKASVVCEVAISKKRKIG